MKTLTALFLLLLCSPLCSCQTGHKVSKQELRFNCAFSSTSFSYSICEAYVKAASTGCEDFGQCLEQCWKVKKRMLPKKITSSSAVKMLGKGEDYCTRYCRTNYR